MVYLTSNYIYEYYYYVVLVYSIGLYLSIYSFIGYWLSMVGVKCKICGSSYDSSNQHPIYPYLL